MSYAFEHAPKAVRIWCDREGSFVPFDQEVTVKEHGLKIASFDVPERVETIGLTAADCRRLLEMLDES